MGGLAIFASVIGAYGLLLAVRLNSGAIVWEGLPLVLRLLPALFIVFSIGLLDDIFGISPWKKLSSDVVAAILAWFCGIHVSGVGGYSFSRLVISFLVTLLWPVTCTNAINLVIDTSISGASQVPRAEGQQRYYSWIASHGPLTKSCARWKQFFMSER